VATIDDEEISEREIHLLEELSRYHEVNFTTVYQKNMRGDGDAIAQAGNFVTSDTMAILFGDDLIHGKENGLQQLVKAYGALEKDKNPALLCLQDVPKELVRKYGIVDIEKSDDRLKKVKGLVEKPKPEDAPSTLGIVGKYIIPRMVIDRLQKIDEGSHGGEVRLIDALIQLYGEMDIYGYVFEGTRLDTGTPEGYKEAVRVLG
jgi:UTP--glucose-1-phosphate uridylyltransferase